MKKLNLNNNIIKIVVALLVLSIGILAYTNKPKKIREAGTLTVVNKGKDLKTYTLEEIKDMRSMKVEKTIVSGKDGDETGIFEGVRLNDILSDVDKNLLNDGKEVITRADDGFESVFSMEEVKKSDNVLVVYGKDNKDLAIKEKGGAGPLRIIVRKDSFGSRSTKYLNEIEVK